MRQGLDTMHVRGTKSQLWLSWLVWAVMLCLPVVASPVLAGQKHALLVGVSQYDNLPKHLQLNGPANDVQLMHNLLLERGFIPERIKVLADGVKGADNRPTRAHILSALQQLAKDAQHDDFVFLLFGGHGSQAPVTAGKGAEEADGLNEIFLPIDSGQWDGTQGTVSNALLDDEIAQSIYQIRNRGAFVWAVFDTCHSGTMTRGMTTPYEKDRKVDPVLDLGMDATLFRQAQSQHVGGSDAPSMSEKAALSKSAGGYVAFFAAQTSEVTPERQLPYGDPNKQPYGLFSYTLSQLLHRNGGLTYRQLAQRILHDYAMNRESTTPLFEGGSFLDAPVFGLKPGEWQREWRVQLDAGTWLMQAGSLHQVGQGSVVALYPTPAAKEEALLGYAQVEMAQITRSHLQPIAHAGLNKPQLSTIEGRPYYARLVSRPMALTLKVAAPLAPLGSVGHLMAAVTSLQENPPDTMQLQWVKPQQGADIQLHIEDGKLWFLPPGGVRHVKESHMQSHAITGQGSIEQLREKVVTSLTSMAKVIQLLRLGDIMTDQPGYQARVEVVGHHSPVKRHGLNAAQEQAIQGYLDHEACAKLPLDQGTPFAFERVATLRNCDQITLAVENPTDRAVDVTILFVDAAYGVTTLFPQDGGPNRIEAGGRLTVLEPTFYSTYADDHGKPSLSIGQEQLIFLAVAAQPNAPQTDFSFLQQESLTLLRDVSSAQGILNTPLTELFKQVGFGHAVKLKATDSMLTRGGFALVEEPTLEASDMRILRWKSSP
ncbi:caspase family protein [Magnetococcus sp. PR-3]|uniref:caspase family protein n=1 Tax=Magnetococcus sp. PR-3 TaxID=3120355 RepID=UPI002FCDF716